MYREVGINFSNVLTNKLEDVENFHKDLIESRENRLKQQRKAIISELSLILPL